MRRRGLHHPPPPSLPLPSPLLSSPSALLAARILSRLSFHRFVFLPSFLSFSDFVSSPPPPSYLRISLFLSLPFILPLRARPPPARSFHPRTVSHPPRPIRRADYSPDFDLPVPLNNDTRVFFARVTPDTRWCGGGEAKSAVGLSLGGPEKGGGGGRERERERVVTSTLVPRVSCARRRRTTALLLFWC